MKKVFYFVSLACMMMFAACSSDNDEFNEENNKPIDGETVMIGVGMPTSDGTRVAFNALDNMVWEDKDQLSFITYYAGYYDSEQAPTISSGIGSSDAKFQVTFKDAKWDNYYKYDAFYKGSKVVYDVNYTNPTDFKYNDQEQTAVNSFAHLRDHILLQSGQRTRSDMINNGVRLTPANCILKLNVKNFPAELQNASDIIVRFYTNYEANMANTPKATVKVLGQMTGENNYVYMAYNPSTLFNGKTIAFEFEGAGKTFKAFAKATSQKQYMAGKIYTVTIDDNNPKAMHWESNEPGGGGSEPSEQLGYHIDFNTKDAISMWYNPDPKNGVNNHFTATLYEFTSPYCMLIEGQGYFVSPKIKLGSKNHISYKGCGYGLKNKDRVSMAIRKVGDTTWKELELDYYSDSNTDPHVTNVKTDFSAYNNQEVEIAFQTKSRSRKWYIYSFTVTAE